MRSFGCACSAPVTLGAVVAPDRFIRPAPVPAGLGAGLPPIQRLRELAGQARLNAQRARVHGYPVESVEYISRSRSLDESVDIVQRLPASAPAALAKANRLDVEAGSARVRVRGAVNDHARAFHEGILDGFEREARLLREAVQRHRGAAFFGDAGASARMPLEIARQGQALWSLVARANPGRISWVGFRAGTWLVHQGGCVQTPLQYPSRWAGRPVQRVGGGIAPVRSPAWAWGPDAQMLPTGELGAADTSANPSKKKRGWYKDSSYGYFFDPKKGITVYRAGKQVKFIAVGEASYAKAYANMFGSGAKNPATRTTKKGAGVKGAAVQVDPALVKQGIEAGASVAVAALQVPQKGGKKKAADDVPADVPPEEPGGLPSWTPWAVGGGLLLLVVGVLVTSGGSKPASAPSRPAASTPTSAAARAA